MRLVYVVAPLALMAICSANGADNNDGIPYYSIYNYCHKEKPKDYTGDVQQYSYATPELCEDGEKKALGTIGLNWRNYDKTVKYSCTRSLDSYSSLLSCLNDEQKNFKEKQAREGQKK